MDGKLVIFSAPSGSGKTTIVREVLKRYPQMEFSISATSRAPRGAERNGVSAVATIIGAADSKTRFAECSRLLNYAFANCRYESVLDQGQSADIEIKVKSGKTKTVVPVAAEKVGMSLMRGEELTVEYVPYDVKAPVAKGDVIAKAIVTCGDRRAEFDLVSPIDIEKASWLDFIRDIADRW